MPKRKVVVEVDIHDDKVSSIEDLERDILHQCYGTFRLDFLLAYLTDGVPSHYTPEMPSNPSCILHLASSAVPT